MKKYKLKNNHILEIHQDNFPDSPNDWGLSDIFLVYNHRDFFVKRLDFDPENIFDYLNNPYPCIFDNFFFIPVYAYIHSGVSLSLSRGHDRWDTSMAGYAVISKDIRKDMTEQDAIDYASNLLEEWNNYLDGNVYYFKLLKAEECDKCHHVHLEEVDRCGGFYGSNIYKNGILESIPTELYTEEILDIINELK